MTDLDELLEANPALPETALGGTATPTKCGRHAWVELGEVTTYGDGSLPDIKGIGWRCLRCHVVKDPIRSRRGRQSRNYGNRAELTVARTYGGQKVGHHGGPVDVRGVDFDTQVRTKRRLPPVEWTAALNAMAGGTRCPRMLLRYVFPGGPEDWFVFRAEDFLDWFGRDEDAEGP